MGRPRGMLAHQTRVWNTVYFKTAVAVVAVFALGTSGYMTIEGWSPWQSFYMTLITVTTVGYSDYDKSEPAQMFSAFLMLGGIGTVSFCLSQIVQNATAKANNPEARMIKLAQRLSDHYVICGMGRTGERVARKLAGEGKEFVAIDGDEERIERFRRDGIIAIRGCATDDTVLMTAGIARAKGLAASTPDDAINAMICLTAKSLNPDIHIAARAERESAVEKLHCAGADVVINPSRYGGDGLVESLVRPDVSCLLYTDASDGVGALRFIEYKVSRGEASRHVTIDSMLREFPKIVFIASKAEGGEMVMRPDVMHELKPDETLVFAGQPEEIARFKSQNKQAA